MRLHLYALVMAAGLALASCSASASGSDEQKLAQNVTQAVYNNDMEAATASFSNSLKPQVTRASLGVLSDQMHKMGNLQSMTEVATEVPTRRYTFDAKFDNGDMTVQMRLDGDGKIVAYRVSPGAPRS